MCGFCDFGQCLGVNLNRHVDILDTSGHWHWVWCHLVCSYSNGVDPYAEALGYFSRSHWRDVAHVVATVCE